MTIMTFDAVETGGRTKEERKRGAQRRLNKVLGLNQSAYPRDIDKLLLFRNSLRFCCLQKLELFELPSLPYSLLQ